MINVKLEWTITDIDATYTSHQTWDPKTMKWVEAKESVNAVDQVATFKLTNYSSKKVVGTVSFEPEELVASTLASATFDENNGKTIDTVVNADYTIDADKVANLPSNTITSTLKFDTNAFVSLAVAATSTKYGTYTITLTDAPCEVCELLKNMGAAVFELFGVDSNEALLAISKEDYENICNTGDGTNYMTALYALLPYVSQVAETKIGVLSDGITELYDASHESSYKFVFSKASCKDDPSIFIYALLQ